MGKRQEYLAGKNFVMPSWTVSSRRRCANEFDENGNIDIGESMKKSSQAIYESMLE